MKRVVLVGVVTGRAGLMVRSQPATDISVESFCGWMTGQLNLSHSTPPGGRKISSWALCPIHLQSYLDMGKLNQRREYEKGVRLKAKRKDQILNMTPENEMNGHRTIGLSQGSIRLWVFRWVTFSNDFEMNVKSPNMWDGIPSSTSPQET
jgi:hypothetical protein